MSPVSDTSPELTPDSGLVEPLSPSVKYQNNNFRVGKCQISTDAALSVADLSVAALSVAALSVAQ